MSHKRSSNTNSTSRCVTFAEREIIKKVVSLCRHRFRLSVKYETTERQVYLQLATTFKRHLDSKNIQIDNPCACLSTQEAVSLLGRKDLAVSSEVRWATFFPTSSISFARSTHTFGSQPRVESSLAISAI